MTAFDDPVAVESPSSWTMSRLGAVPAGGGDPDTGVERVLSRVDVNAVITPLGGTNELVTVLDARAGAVTAGTFGYVVGCSDAGQKRLDVHMSSGKPATFSFANNEVRVGSAATIRFADDGVEVRTALLRAGRGPRGTDVRLAGTSARAVHDISSGAVRATVAGDAKVDVRLDARVTELVVADDVLVRVSRDDLVEVSTPNDGTAFRFDPGTDHVAFTSADGVAGVSAGSGITITCARSGWRVFATEWLVSIECEKKAEGLVWDRVTEQVIATAELSPGGVMTTWTGRELRVDLDEDFSVVAADRVRIRWSGKDFVICGGRVVVADAEEDWYLSPDGRLTTAGCVVSAQQTVDGRPEALVRGTEHEWCASVWAGGALIDHGGDLRTVLDEDGVVSAPVARADSSVVSRRGASTVISDSVQVDITSTEEVSLRSGSAELRARRRHADGVLHSTISDDVFTIVVENGTSDSFAWQATHLHSSISHVVRDTCELVVRNSPSGRDFMATAHEVRVMLP